MVVNGLVFIGYVMGNVLILFVLCYWGMGINIVITQSVQFVYVMA